jgi:hypothetical protein
MDQADTITKKADTKSRAWDSGGEPDSNIVAENNGSLALKIN